MSTPTILQQYDPGLFINREAEQDFVLDKVAKLLDGDFVEKRTVIFTGEHGMGKSWLMLHLRHRLLHEPQFKGVVACHLDLSSYQIGTTPDVVINDLLAKAYHELRPDLLLSEAIIERQSYQLIDALKQPGGQQPFVLLVDSVYESPREWLPLLENYLLAPLATIPHVLLVMAGRGQPYPWRAPELRLRADFYHDSLSPFEFAATEKQLAYQLSGTQLPIAEIFRYSRGNPKANFLLASKISVPNAFNQIIEEMLITIPLQQRSEVRISLEALSILRQFDQSRIPVLLRAYDPDKYSMLQRRAIQGVLDNLLKPELAFWNKEAAAYTFHPFTRNMALQYLFAAQPVIWRRLSESARDLYLSWVEKYPQNESLWQSEADYHQRQLNATNQQEIE